MTEIKNTPSEKQEIIDEVIGFNVRKLWKTCKDLTFHPGETVAAYCDESRSKYISPIAYFLLCYGINFFVLKLVGFFNYDPLNGSVSERPDLMLDLFINGMKAGNLNMTEEKIAEFVSRITPAFEFLSSKEGLLLVTLPIIILMQWLFFKSFRKPFLQNVYFVLFVSAQINLITIPLALPFAFTFAWYWPVTIVTLIFEVSFYFYAEFRFYPRITISDIASRTLLQMIAGIIPYILWYFIVISVTIFIYARFL